MRTLDLVHIMSESHSFSANFAQRDNSTVQTTLALKTLLTADLDKQTTLLGLISKSVTGLG